MNFEWSLSLSGISFDLNPNDRSSVRVTEIPACFMDREASEQRRGRSSVATDKIEVGEIRYRKVSNIRRTKCQILNVSRLGFQLSLRNILKPSVKWRMKMQLEQCRQVMLQLHLSDRQFNCLLKCVLYYRLEGIFSVKWNLSKKNASQGGLNCEVVSCKE